VALEQLQEAWQRTILAAVRDKSIPTASVLAEARPVALEDEALTVEFPPTASFHRELAEEEKNASLLRDALYEVTGKRLKLAFTIGDDDGTAEAPDETPATEDEIYELVKETFDATEVTD